MLLELRALVKLLVEGDFKFNYLCLLYAISINKLYIKIIKLLNVVTYIERIKYLPNKNKIISILKFSCNFNVNLVLQNPSYIAEQTNLLGMWRDVVLISFAPS